MTSITELHDIAKQRFYSDTSKCYQRHIRELHGEREQRTQIPNLDGAVVERIPNAEAKEIIERYEWLRKMGSGTIACYGLKINGELLGVACFGKMGQKISQICEGTPNETAELAQATVCLQRGACVPHAPKNAASFLIRKACRLRSLEFGWKIFFAYSDSAAGEVGTVYQASNWFYIGTGLGRPKGSFHTDYTSPDQKTVLTSYAINHNRLKLMKKYKCPSNIPFRQFLTRNGWTQIRHYSGAKGKYVWFEGSGREKETLKSQCRYPFLPYPKRTIPQQEREAA
jgi:hypothetical protein